MIARYTALAAPALILAGLGPVHAQSAEDRIAALEARIQTLEQSQEPLSFGSGNTAFEFYGYVKADFIYDFDFELGDTTFALGSLDDSQDGEEFFNATVRQTRLGVRTTTQTGMGELGTQVEIDFFGPDQIEPRIRHANITLGGLRVGQYWTTFMPISSYPVTLDFQGVAGIPFARQEQIRYTHEFGGSFVAEVALEEHNGDSDSPVLIGALAYDTDPLLVRASAIAGEVNDGLGGDEDVHGFNLSTTAQLWQGATLDAAYTIGDGIATYMVFGGDDVDADGDAIEVQSAYIGLTQEVGEQWTLRGIYGYRENDSGPLDGTESLESIHLNATYQLVENATVGIEYFHGERDTFGGGDFSVDRIQTSFQVNF